MPQVLLLLLSLLHLERLFNKQGLKPRQTRLSTWAEATVACGGFFSVRFQPYITIQRTKMEGASSRCVEHLQKAPRLQVAFQVEAQETMQYSF